MRKGQDGMFLRDAQNSLLNNNSTRKNGLQYEVNSGRANSLRVKFEPENGSLE